MKRGAEVGAEFARSRAIPWQRDPLQLEPAQESQEEPAEAWFECFETVGEFFVEGQARNHAAVSRCWAQGDPSFEVGPARTLAADFPGVKRGADLEEGMCKARRSSPKTQKELPSPRREGARSLEPTAFPIAEMFGQLAPSSSCMSKRLPRGRSTQNC